MKLCYQYSWLQYTLIVVLIQINFLTSAELVVNIKNKGGDVDKEKINANITADTVTLEYQPKDGTFITWFIDFKSV